MGEMDAGGETAAQRTPAPPGFRRGDERRTATTRPGLCEFCQLHPRKPASSGGGPRPRYCATAWGQDHRGREVTCARLDEAHDLWLAVYGSTGPLSQLDVGAQVSHLSGLRTAIDPLLAALVPVRDDLDQLDERLTGEAADALTRAEQAAAAAEQARRDQEAAERARDEAVQARERAEIARDDALRVQRQSVAEKDTAQAAQRLAEQRENDANARALAAIETAKAANAALRQANTTIADQATRIGALTGANEQLATRVDELTTKVHRRDCDLTELRTKFERERQDSDRQANEKIGELTAQLARATARAEEAHITAERYRAAADDLTRLRMALLTALATNDDLAALRAGLTQLITADEGPADPTMGAARSVINEADK